MRKKGINDGEGWEGFQRSEAWKVHNLYRASRSVGFAPHGKRYLFPASPRAAAVTDRHVL
jgi:hypothetical protein